MCHRNLRLSMVRERRQSWVTICAPAGCSLTGSTCSLLSPQAEHLVCCQSHGHSQPSTACSRLVPLLSHFSHLSAEQLCSHWFGTLGFPLLSLLPRRRGHFQFLKTIKLSVTLCCASQARAAAAGRAQLELQHPPHPNPQTLSTAKAPLTQTHFACRLRFKAFRE